MNKFVLPSKNASDIVPIEPSQLPSIEFDINYYNKESLLKRRVGLNKGGHWEIIKKEANE